MPTNGNSVGDGEFKVYFYRWIILALFSSVNLCNAFLWVTFAPISDLTATFIGGDIGNTTAVNFLATVFLILYLPGSFVGVYVNKTLGLKATVVVGALLNVMGALIRLAGAFAKDHTSSSWIFSLLLLGQCISSICQPVVLNIASTISNEWFPISERDIATTVSSMFNPIGCAVGQFIPALLVSQNASNGTISGMTTLLGFEFALCAVSLACVLAFFQSSPPTPPSPSAAMRSLKSSQKENENDERRSMSRQIDIPYTTPTPPPLPQQQQHNIRHSVSSARLDRNSIALSVIDDYTTLKREIRDLFCDWNYLLLFITLSIAVGLFNVIVTLPFQLIQPFGYSNDDAGLFGTLFGVGGLIGAALGCWVLKRYKRYKLTVKVYIYLCLISVLIFVCMLRPDNYSPLLISFVLMGFAILPLLPILMETCAECSYPISEDVSAGCILVGASYTGVAFIFGLQVLIDLPPIGPLPLTPSNLFLLGSFAYICIFIYLYIYLFI